MWKSNKASLKVKGVIVGKAIYDKKVDIKKYLVSNSYA